MNPLTLDGWVLLGTGSFDADGHLVLGQQIFLVIPGKSPMIDSMQASELSNVAAEAEQDPLAEIEGAWTRRAILAGGLIAGVAGMASEAEAQAAPPDMSTYWVSPEGRLLRRISYGITSTERTSALAKGFVGYRDYQLGYAAINDTFCQAEVATRFPRLGLSAGQLLQQSDDWVTIQQFGEATIYRAVNSNRQLFEKMVEFWHDHFNVSIDKTQGYFTVPFNRDVIRPNALGTFPNLLKAVANSACMMVYLDNTENIGDWGNVNFARELMELHTLGVTGGYTPADIRNVQRCFSGWSIQWDSSHPNYGGFAFYDWGHSTLPKTVLGQSINFNDKRDGDAVLDILAAHPNTAKFLSKKLAKFLLAYEPSPALVDAVAAEYLNTGGSIPAMIKVILTQANVMASPAKYKRPYQLMMGALRSLKATFATDLWTLRYEHLYQAGQLPFSWSPPDGYPDKVDFWAGLILPRWNFALMLPQNYVWNVSIDLPNLLSGANTPQAVADRIDLLICNGEMAPDDKQDVLNYLTSQAMSDKRKQGALAIALASPSFQWY